MLPLIAVLLAAAPHPPPPSLLAPESGRYLSARLLVAQAPQEPPLDAPTPPPPPPPDLDAEREERIRELTRQVGLLQDELRVLSVDWPTGALVMSITGYVLSPLLLLGLPLIIFGLGGLGETAGDEAETLLAVGLGMTVAGVGGIGLIVGGIISGVRHSATSRARRDELVRQRIRLEDELRDLKSRRDARGTLQARRWAPCPTLPLVALRF